MSADSLNDAAIAAGFAMAMTDDFAEEPMMPADRARMEAAQSASSEKDASGQSITSRVAGLIDSLWTKAPA
jgi:hypothetical protein